METSREMFILVDKYLREERIGDLFRTLREMDRADDEPWDCYAAFSRAQRLLQEKKEPFGTLFELAEEWIRQSPDDPWGYRLNSLAHHCADHIDEAVDAGFDAYECDPENPFSIVDLAWTLIWANAGTEASFYAGQLREHAPDWSETHALLGYLCLTRRRWEEGQTHLEEALKRAPENYRAIFNLHLVLRRNGLHSRAFELLAKCLHGEPWDLKNKKVAVGYAENVLWRGTPRRIGTFFLWLMGMLGGVETFLAIRHGGMYRWAWGATVFLGVAVLFYLAVQVKSAARSWPEEIRDTYSNKFRFHFSGWGAYCLWFGTRPGTLFWLGLFCGWLATVSHFLVPMVMFAGASVLQFFVIRYWQRR